MNKIGFVLEYEEVLLGQRQDFSPTYIKRGTPEKDVVDVLKYAFIDLLGWTPQQVFSYINPKLIHALRLDRVVAKIDYPIGLNKEKDLNYLASVIFPEAKQLTKEQIALEIYKKVLNGELNKYPKNFFMKYGSDRYIKGCMRYAVEEFANTYNPVELYKKFADPEWTAKFLERAQLDTVTSDMYEYPVDLLHISLTDEQKNEFWYQFVRFQNDLYQTKKRRPRKNADKG